MIERRDTNKIDGLFDWITCHYWLFLRINVRFQPNVCDGCHNVTPPSMSFDDPAVLTF